MKPEENYGRSVLKWPFHSLSLKYTCSLQGGGNGVQHKEFHLLGNCPIVGVIRIGWGVMPAGRCPEALDF